jgi:hypothetical protein
VRGNSSFVNGWENSAFFSDFLALAMTLQMEQGCCPSNVRATASVNETVRRLSASILVQATDCNAPQCAPLAARSKAISKALRNRIITTLIYLKLGRVVKRRPVVLPCLMRMNHYTQIRKATNPSDGGSERPVAVAGGFCFLVQTQDSTEANYEHRSNHRIC